MKKILVIEDEPEMRRNIVALLRYRDYAPIEAENGRKGVELAKREKPDLILCDVMMPELEFIFLTAKGEKDDLRSGMDLGADDYLTKPVANALLVRAIEARLRRSQQQAKRESKPDSMTTGVTPSPARKL
jgi:DNA-binding response OmpR family regulator